MNPVGKPVKITTTMITVLFVFSTSIGIAQDETIAVDDPPPKLTGLKAEAADSVDAMRKMTQEIVDSLFSFAELGFQEFETQRYLTEILEQNGFNVETGVSGIPSAWWATWGEGKPVIALGTDVDGIPKSSQMPGVTYRQPMIEGAPGQRGVLEGSWSGALRPGNYTLLLTVVSSEGHGETLERGFSVD